MGAPFGLRSSQALAAALKAHPGGLSPAAMVSPYVPPALQRRFGLSGAPAPQMAGSANGVLATIRNTLPPAVASQVTDQMFRKR